MPVISNSVFDIEDLLLDRRCGDEFLMPLQAFFCSLCCEFSKDSTSAEAHTKSREHNNKFKTLQILQELGFGQVDCSICSGKNFLKDNPNYEMQYLHGKMMAVNAAARRETEEKQGMVAAVSDLQTKPVTVSQGMAAVVGNLQIRPLTERQGMVISVSDLQKRPVMETEENNEVKRVKINPTDTKQQMENIVDEEWRRMALSIEKQTRAIRLKTEDAIEMKVGEFDSDLKRTIINKPSSESKPTMSGNVSGSKVIIDSHQKKITVSENTSRAKQDQATEKPQGLKRRRWDDEEHRERKCDDDDKRLRQKQSPSSRSARTPPRSYRSKVSPPRPRQTGRSIWSLKDDKAGKYPTAIKNADQKASTQSRGDVIIVDDDQPKVSSSAKGADKSAVLKPTSSSQQTTTTSTATTAASSASSFKFSWKAKTAKPPLIQYGPRPGSKAPAKGAAEMNINIDDFEVFDED